MSDTDQETTSSPAPAHRLAQVLPLAGGMLGAIAFAVTMLPVSLPWKAAAEQAPQVVTFDTAKYVNARRAAASELLGTSQESDAAVSTLARVDRGVRPAIEEAAGGAVVIVRQAAVLDGNLPDITDTVLRDLGLPTDTPTIETSIDRPADTNYSASSLYEEARELVSRANQDARTRLETRGQADIEELLP